MNTNILPHGSAPAALDIPHFPTRFQAVIFRNWGIVPAERIAAALNTDAQTIISHAAKMGLDTANLNCDLWLKRGYVSIIRTNWQLLNYEGIIKLLDWTPEKLLDTLQNEDFLYIKLGSLKPECPDISCRPLTVEEEKQTAKIADTVRKYRPSYPTEKPFAFVNKISAKNSFKNTGNDGNIYIAYSYSALYGDSLAMPELDPYPDNLLQALAEKGINGIWIPGILYQLHYWKDAPELSQNYEKRIESLNALVAKVAKYGMKVYLYLNEPRGLSITQYQNNTFMREKYLGTGNISHNLYSMCTAKSAVLEYLTNAVKSLFSSVPGLGGAFMITQSENMTHCASRSLYSEPADCPLCAKKAKSAIIAEILTTITDAAHSVAPDADIICWDWAWYEKWIPEIIEALPEKTSIMAVSESHVPVEFGGIKTEVVDYSLSHYGPGEKSKNTWKTAAKKGLKNFAKIQISTTWEGSAVPYLPVSKLLEAHLQGLRDIGIKNYVTNWTLGGYPSFNMDLLKMSHDEMVEKNFGIKAAKNITLALEYFSEAFRNFPFDVTVVYNSPHNIGPANLLYSKPTNYAATMVGIPYDDLKRWVGPYTPEIYIDCLEKLCGKWRQGLEYLKLAEADITSEFEENYQDLRSVAEACFCSYASAANQAKYINELRGTSRKDETVRLLNDEINLAAELLELARKDSRLGFEATNHYAYTHNELLEKIICCEWIKNKVLS